MLLCPTEGIECGDDKDDSECHRFPTLPGWYPSNEIGLDFTSGPKPPEHSSRSRQENHIDKQVGMGKLLVEEDEDESPIEAQVEDDPSRRQSPWPFVNRGHAITVSRLLSSRRKFIPFHAIRYWLSGEIRPVIAERIRGLSRE
jgi:hypothetical protein